MHWIDHTHLPQVSGSIESLIYNQHGELDGVWLDDGREVHVPPHLAARGLRPGQPFSVHYVKPKDADVFVAVAVDLPSGKQVVDEGPHGHEPAQSPKTRPAHVAAQVRSLIHAPRGEVHGAVLEDGSIVRFHPRGNEDIAAYFEPEAQVEVWGEGFKKHGAWVIELAHVAKAA